MALYRYDYGATVTPRNKQFKWTRSIAQTAHIGELGSHFMIGDMHAIEALFQATQGLPRKINRIAHYALSAAALTKAKQVRAEHLQAALDELQP